MTKILSKLNCNRGIQGELDEKIVEDLDPAIRLPQLKQKNQRLILFFF